MTVALSAEGEGASLSMDRAFAERPADSDVLGVLLAARSLWAKLYPDAEAEECAVTVEFCREFGPDSADES